MKGKLIAMVKIDGWGLVSREVWQDGEDRFDTRVETGYKKPLCESLAVSYWATGRKVYPNGSVRGKICFIGDGEPDITVGCYIWEK